MSSKANRERRAVLSPLANRYYDESVNRRDRTGIQRKVTLASIMRGHGAPEALIKLFLAAMPRTNGMRARIKLETPGDLRHSRGASNDGTRVALS